MAFKDYSTSPSENTSLGDGTYIGANMHRNKVRPALQQIAADGKALADYLDTAITSIDTGNVADLLLRPQLSTASGGSLIAYAAAGSGAVARLIQDKLRDTVHAKDFGLVGNGSDETAKLTAFWNSAITRPGVPHYLEAKTYGLSAPLPAINVSNVWIEGAGAEVHDTGTLMTGTVIRWIGAASPSSTMADIAPVVGSSNQRLSGIFFRYIGLDANSGGIGRCLSATSLQESEIDVATANASFAGVILSVASPLGEAADLQRNKIRVNGRQVEAPNGYTLTLTGNATANVSLNEIEVDAQLSNAPAILCDNSDNNNWKYVRCFKTASGTALYGIVLEGGDTEAFRSRSENILFYSGNVPVAAGGTDTFAVASTGHVIARLDLDNSTPPPIIGSGASCIVRNRWLPYSPTLVASSGSLGSWTGSGEYFVEDGGFVSFKCDISLTNNGTAAGFLSIGLPLKSFANSISSLATGKEGAVTGKMLAGRISPNSIEVPCQFYDGTYPGGNGYAITISGTYRAAV